MQMMYSAGGHTSCTRGRDIGATHEVRLSYLKRRR